MTEENGRVGIIIEMLKQMNEKLDNVIRDTQDDLNVVHSRINKVENRVTRIEAIGSVLQFIWGAVLTYIGKRGI